MRQGVCVLPTCVTAFNNREQHEGVKDFDSSHAKQKMGVKGSKDIQGGFGCVRGLAYYL